jgi:hypothetical protein
VTLGNVPKDDGGLLLTREQLSAMQLAPEKQEKWIKKAFGSTEYIQGKTRFCLWLFDDDLEEANRIPEISRRIEEVQKFRESSVDPGMASMASRPHQFREMNIPQKIAILIPRVSSERRDFLPTGIIGNDSIITDRNYAIYDQPLLSLSLIASRLHWVWIGTVCVRMRTDFSYSNTLGWNTFPVPTLTDQNKADLTRCAEEILLAREHYFPATIAHMYDPTRMDSEFPLVREAHNRNDEVIDRIYIGRRFKNDTERLEKLFELYTKMTNQPAIPKKSAKPKG